MKGKAIEIKSKETLIKVSSRFSRLLSCFETFRCLLDCLLMASVVFLNDVETCSEKACTCLRALSQGKFQNNIELKPQVCVCGGASFQAVPLLRRPQKEKCRWGLRDLNPDIVSHSVATWTRWNITPTSYTRRIRCLPPCALEIICFRPLC